MSSNALRAALLPALLLAAPALAQEPQRSPYEALARDLLEELVEINTTHSVGDNTAAARAMEARLLAAGFPREDVRVLVPENPRKGNLVARLRGRNPDLKPILLLAHLDVVEANPEDWTLPPFELIEREGVFYGRGVADDKDEAAIHVTNLIRLEQEGFVPERDIVVALTADEEGGGSNGVDWLLKNHRPLVDAAFVINEGGGGVMENGRRISNSVGAAEKRFGNFLLETTNPGGHSSVPREDNAIYDLADGLSRLRSHRMPVRLNDVTRAYFERSAPLVSPELEAAMRALVADPTDEPAIATLQKDPRFNSMMRTTCVATLLEGGHASNALPQRARATVNCRMLPDENPEDVREALQRAVGDRVKVISQVGSRGPSPASPLSPEVLGPIEKVTQEMWPGLSVVPTMGTGATDGLYFRAAGIPSYGVSGLFYGDTNSHGMNERVPVDAFYQGLEFLYRLTRELTSGDGT